MVNNRFIIVGILVLGLLWGAFASAHQPEYVNGRKTIAVVDPVVSKAYYGYLSGAPAEFSVQSDTEFALYLNILSADIPAGGNLSALTPARKDFSVLVKDGQGAQVALLEGVNFDWKQWHEEFAGDDYWKGPEFQQTVPAGDYLITVSNQENKGSYVLAIGEKESFPPSQLGQILGRLYLVKTSFFNKSPVSIFEGKIGKYLWGCFGLVVILVIFLIWLLTKRGKNESAITE